MSNIWRDSFFDVGRAPEPEPPPPQSPIDLFIQHCRELAVKQGWRAVFDAVRLASYVSAQR